MASSDLIRQELQNLDKMPPWGRRQADHWDRLSNFVYRSQTLQGLQRQARAIARSERLDEQAFENYAVRRWYNHHTHDQLLAMFLAHPDVRPEADPKHPTIDFYLRGLPFDLKISRFPQAYPEDIKHAWQYRHDLALWMYTNQSKQRRYHTGNRLFIILYDRARPEQSWQLRRDFAPLARLLQHFLDNPILLGLRIRDHQRPQVHLPWSGIIFHVR